MPGACGGQPGVRKSSTEEVTGCLCPEKQGFQCPGHTFCGAKISRHRRADELWDPRWFSDGREVAGFVGRSLKKKENLKMTAAEHDTERGSLGPGPV